MKKITILILFITTVMNYTFAGGGAPTPVNSINILATSAPLSDSTILFPDAIFKKHLTDNSSINTDGDKSNISIQEALHYTGKIDISNDTNIKSVLGIEYFSNLTVFYCSNTKVDITASLAGNTHLDTLIDRNNINHGLQLNKNITYIDVTGQRLPYATYNGGYKTTIFISTLGRTVNNANYTVTSHNNITILSDSVINPGTNKNEVGYTYQLGEGTMSDTSNPSGNMITPTYTLVNINKPSTCNNIFGLVNVRIPFDSIIWNTGDKTPLLFNKCSGQYTAKVYGCFLDSGFYTAPGTYKLVNFFVTDTIVNNPNTYSTTPTSTTTVTATSCAAIPSNTPQIVAFANNSYYVPGDTSHIRLIWSYSATSLVDSFTTVAPYQAGLQEYVAFIQCPDGSTRPSKSLTTSTTITEVTDYVMINSTTPGIHWKYSNLTTVIEEVHSYDTEVTVAPNPFSVTTKVTVPVGLMNGKIKIISTTGTEISTQIIQENVTEINRDGLSSGIYFLQITSNNEAVATKKVIIE